MAAEVGLTQSAVHRIWRAFGLQPHRAETFKLSRDPQFVAKVRDVVGLYLNPPERAVVLCVDEKCQIQALDRTAADPADAARAARARHPRLQTPRHLQPLRRAGSQHRQGDRTLHSRHRAIEFKQFLQTLDREVPADLDVHVILDNSSTHKTPAIRKWLTAHPRFVLHFTPTQLVVAQPRRALVRRADQQEAQARRTPLRPRTQRRHPGMDEDLERRPKALRVD